MASQFFSQSRMTNVNQQIEQLQENQSQEVKNELENRQLQKNQLIESAKANTEEIHELGSQQILEGSLEGIIPGINGINELRKLYSKAQDTVNTVKDNVNQIKETINPTTEPIETTEPTETPATQSIEDMRQGLLDRVNEYHESLNPVFPELGEAQKNESINLIQGLTDNEVPMYTKAFEGVPTNQAMPQARVDELVSNIKQQSIQKPQFGDDIDYTGTQLSTTPTPVLPTETMANDIIGSSKSSITDAIPIIGEKSITDSITEQAPSLIKKSLGFVGDEEGAGLIGGVGEALGAGLDALGPIGALAGVGFGIYSAIKGALEEKKNIDAPAPPPLPELQQNADISAEAQPGV